MMKEKAEHPPPVFSLLLLSGNSQAGIGEPKNEMIITIIYRLSECDTQLSVRHGILEKTNREAG